jgi:hypothetical protein
MSVCERDLLTAEVAENAEEAIRISNSEIANLK